MNNDTLRGLLGRRTLLGGAAGLGAAALGASPAAAQRSVDFSGRTIEWNVPFAEGGGSDVWARFMAPYLARSEERRVGKD